MLTAIPQHATLCLAGRLEVTMRSALGGALNARQPIYLRALILYQHLGHFEKATQLAKEFDPCVIAAQNKNGLWVVTDE